MLAEIRLFIMFITLLVGLLFEMSYFLYTYLTDNVPLDGTREEAFLLVMQLEFALIVSIVLLLDAMRKNCTIITIRETGITLEPLFCIRRQQEMPFYYYPRIHYAYYLHGSLITAYRVHYFVLTNKKLTQDELCHINLVTPSVDLIKICYSERRFSRLLSCLPPHLANELTRIKDVYIT